MMNEQMLIDSLGTSCQNQRPVRADVIALTPLGRDDLHARLSRFMSVLHDTEVCRQDRANLTEQAERSVVQLPEGARAVVYHASGTLHYASGLGPLAAPFATLEPAPTLVRQLEAAASKLQLASWVGERGSLAFERLWQTKAAGTDREERVSEPTLVRALGAWRQSLDGIAVLGAASATIRLAGDGNIDALGLQMRPYALESVDTAVVIDPELAAREILARLTSVLGKAKERLPTDAIESAEMRFGYLDLGKRKSQHVLAPVYVAQIAIAHKLERQAYVLAVNGTERPYLDLPLFGAALPLLRERSQLSPCRTAEG